MADTSDLKSDEHSFVRVRAPPALPQCSDVVPMSGHFFYAEARIKPLTAETFQAGSAGKIY